MAASCGLTAWSIPPALSTSARTRSPPLAPTRSQAQRASSVWPAAGAIEQRAQFPRRPGRCAGKHHRVDHEQCHAATRAGRDRVECDRNRLLLGASNLVFKLGGLIQGTQYGFLNVTGNVSLGGNLVVSFVNSFVAQNNDSFTVLSSTAPLSGTFANVASGGRLTEGGTGGSFLVNYSGSTIIFSDFQGGPVPPLPASTNSGGAVQIDRPVAVNRAGPQSRTLAMEVNPDSPASARGTALMARRAQGSSPPQRVRAQGIAMQDSDQLLELLDGEQATTVRGKVTVKTGRAAKAANGKGRAIRQGGTISEGQNARSNTIVHRRDDRSSDSLGRGAVGKSAARGRPTD